MQELDRTRRRPIDEVVRAKLGTSTGEVAMRLQVSRGVASELLNGKVVVNTVLATKLAGALGGQPRDFMHLEEDRVVLN